MRGFFKSDFWIGAILLTEAVILLLSVKGWLSDSIPFISREFEIVIALIVVLVGLQQIQIYLRKKSRNPGTSNPGSGHSNEHAGHEEQAGNEVHGGHEEFHADSGSHDAHAESHSDAHAGAHDDHGGHH